jgi:hypothetical protein
MNRRTALTLSGTAAAAALGAGCLSERTDPGSAGDSDDDDSGDEHPDPDGDTEYVVALEDAPATDETDHAALRVELVDSGIAPDDPARFVATLTNTTDETLVVSSGAPSPFGVVRASPDDSDDFEKDLTLWTDDYEDSSHVGTDGKQVTGVDDIGLVEELDAGEAIEQEFELHPETPNLEAGAYEAELGSNVWPDGDGEDGSGPAVTLSFSVAERDDAVDDADAVYEVADDAPSLDPDGDGFDGGGEGVLVLESEADADEAFDYGDGDAEPFVSETDFGSQALIYVRAEAPQTCYRTSIRSLSWEDGTLLGNAVLERTVPEGEPCSDVITYPAALVRVEFESRNFDDADVAFVRE